MLPAINDLSIGLADVSKVILTWSNPALAVDAPPEFIDHVERFSQRITVTDYAIRFGRNKMEMIGEDWYRAHTIRFRSTWMDDRVLESEERNTNAFLDESPEFVPRGRRYHHNENNLCRLEISYGKKLPRGPYGKNPIPSKRPPYYEKRMMREAQRGCFALKYKVGGIGWSPISNSAFNPSDVAPHKLTIQTSSAGVSAGAASGGLMEVKISDPRLRRSAS